MNPPLSKRLLTCCSFVSHGDRVADIGCDHGYLGIYLLKNNIASSIVASDVRKMPLRSAMVNAEKYGVQDRITFFLSNGVNKIPRDFNTLVCAGMGADTIMTILSDAPWLMNSQYRLILQCQSKTPELRRYLSDQGWRIAEETVLRDGKFLYTVMDVHWNPDSPKLTIGQTYFPPTILNSPTLELQEYFQRLLFSLHRKLNAQGETADPTIKDVLNELEQNHDLDWLKEKKDDNCC